jgi:hypothetical protein
MPGSSDLPGRHDKPGSPRPGEAGAAQHPDVPDASAEQAAGSRRQLQSRLGRLRHGHPSSPYREDGSRRPEAVDLREFELAPDADEIEPRKPGDVAGKAGSADHPEHRAQHADSRPGHPDDHGSAGWRTALPRLRALWESHKDRWPAGQRTSVDRSADEEGSWRGDGPGQYLTRAENLAAGRALDRVRETEREVTQTMKTVEAEVPGARLVGLENRLKGEQRFKEKVAEELHGKHERSIAEIIERMPDAVRYTYQFDVDDYVDRYEGVCRSLEAHGSQMLLCRNYWDNPDYKGVNTRWLTANGHVCEVQFHTADSFQAKQLTHDAYERLRTSPAPSPERPELESFQQTVTSNIRVPAGAEVIVDYRREGY